MTTKYLLAKMYYNELKYFQGFFANEIYLTDNSTGALRFDSRAEADNMYSRLKYREPDDNWFIVSENITKENY